MLADGRVCDRLAFTFEEAIQFFAVNGTSSLVCRRERGVLQEVDSLYEAELFFGGAIFIEEK